MAKSISTLHLTGSHTFGARWEKQNQFLEVKEASDQTLFGLPLSALPVEGTLTVFVKAETDYRHYKLHFHRSNVTNVTRCVESIDSLFSSPLSKDQTQKALMDFTLSRLHTLRTRDTALFKSKLLRPHNSLATNSTRTECQSSPRQPNELPSPCLTQKESDTIVPLELYKLDSAGKPTNTSVFTDLDLGQNHEDYVHISAPTD
ncbi:MAG: hypothetical protein ACPGUD_10335 [Parashewanella sp.]